MIKQWTLATLALLLLQSCAWNDDISRLQTPEWNGEIAAPIAKGTISIAQVLDQFGDFSFVDVEPDGTLVVHADFSLGQWALPQFIQLPDLPIPFVENSLQVPFPLPEIERLELKQGFLQYSIRHGGNEALRVDFRIRELLHGGEETRFSVDVPSAGLFQNEIDISGYAFVPQHGRFSLSYDAYFAANGDPATVDQVMLTFHDMLPSYAEGILPELDMALEIDTLDVKIDLGMDLPEFTLNEPRIEFVFESQVGVPGIFSFPSFSLQNDAGENLALIYAPFQDGTTLLRPESPTAWAETRFALDKTNSNLVEMLSQGIPKRLMYEAAITAFPAG
ncbi:MAG: hypothetical protein NWR72_05575, partial [Bacteroidia bacterium]|nr:hypothetical protein [Bacteroidia bacterium]